MIAAATNGDGDGGQLGAAALAGFPLLSGFWSKDEILATTFEAGHHGSVIYSILFCSALVTAGLTAFSTISTNRSN